MKKIRVFISNFPFARDNKEPLEILVNQGYEVVQNPLGRKLKPEETAKLACEFDGIVAGTENLKPLVENTDSLKIISRIGIGLDNIPYEDCIKKGIEFAYTPDAVTPAVTELTIGLMISLTRGVVFADREIRNNQWSRPYGKRIGKSVIGIIGFGRVGSAVARLLLPFGPLEVLVNDIKNIDEKVETLKKSGLNITKADKEDIYSRADIISLHLPLSKETLGIINSKSLGLMGSHTFLVNTARGDLVNEDDLFISLNDQKIGGAALDVFSKEPYNGKLSGLDNVLLTEHIGSCSYDCRYQMEKEAALSIVDFFSGKGVSRKPKKEDFYL